MTGPPLNYVSQSGKRAVNEQLDRILESGLFAHSLRRQRFLEYIVTETLAGRGDRLKGYSVALEVFDRTQSFDPVADPIVRVEAARLREKLRDYYDGVGRNDPILIEIPKGTYTPSIEFRKSGPRDPPQRPDTSPRDPAGLPQTVRDSMLGTRNRAAHNELLRGLDRFWRYSREACGEAQLHFGRAVDLDPDYAVAHAWLARTHVWQACMNWVPDCCATYSSIDLADRHCQRAFELDDRLPLAHSIFGKVQLYLHDGEAAVLEARKACALDPNSAEPKMFLSFILATTGHAEEALRNIETAILLQPHPSSYYFETLGLSYFARADYDRAIVAFLHGIEINPAYMPCHYELAVTYGVCGRAEAAQSEAALVKADWPDVSAEFIVDPTIAEIYFRGKKAAGLV